MVKPKNYSIHILIEFDFANMYLLRKHFTPKGVSQSLGDFE